MRIRNRNATIRHARRWAVELHYEVMAKMPDELKAAIDWAKVATNLGFEWPEFEQAEVEEHIQRIVDYLYDDEAEDYTYAERQFKQGHIFKSICIVSRWLSRERAERE